MFLRENETLYLDSWNYNKCLILEELAKIAVNNGGRVKPERSGFIVNRSINEFKQKAKIDLEKIRENIKRLNLEITEARAQYIAKREKELETFSRINNEPRRVEHLDYVKFILGDNYYYLQLDDNPFFEFYFEKTRIENNKIKRYVYLSELSKNWLLDCLLTFPENEEEHAERISEAAKAIFEQLSNAAPSKPYTESTRKRVANTYNGGYHYEIVRKPIEYKTIDF